MKIPHQSDRSCLVPPRDPMGSRYLVAITYCSNAPAARRRFIRYDAHREFFAREIDAWLFGKDSREVATLAELALKAGKETFPGESNPGLLEYLCLLHDDVRAEHQSTL